VGSGGRRVTSQISFGYWGMGNVKMFICTTGGNTQNGFTSIEARE
jgi:hypothetical protein